MSAMSELLESGTIHEVHNYPPKSLVPDADHCAPGADSVIVPAWVPACDALI
jgi:hypothetical protein